MSLSPSLLSSLLLLLSISFSCPIINSLPFLHIRTIRSPIFFHSSVRFIPLSPSLLSLIFFSHLLYLNNLSSFHYTYPSNGVLGFPDGERNQLYVDDSTVHFVNNQKFMEELIAYFPFTVIWVSHASRKETLVCMCNEVNKTIQFWRLQCWYYWWVWFM
jgi:hypothetical protein